METVARLSLSEASSQLLNECRMVLPGIQTLLGFQLIAVFQPPFTELPRATQRLHLFAILCVVLAIGLHFRRPVVRAALARSTGIARRLALNRGQRARREGGRSASN